MRRAQSYQEARTQAQPLVDRFDRDLDIAYSPLPLGAGAEPSVGSSLRRDVGNSDLGRLQSGLSPLPAAGRRLGEGLGVRVPRRS
jgi:hypothetical protein